MGPEKIVTTRIPQIASSSPLWSPPPNVEIRYIAGPKWILWYPSFIGIYSSTLKRRYQILQYTICWALPKHQIKSGQSVKVTGVPLKYIQNKQILFTSRSSVECVWRIILLGQLSYPLSILELFGAQFGGPTNALNHCTLVTVIALLKSLHQLTDRSSNQINICLYITRQNLGPPDQRFNFSGLLYTKKRQQI